MNTVEAQVALAEQLLDEAEERLATARAHVEAAVKALDDRREQLAYWQGIAAAVSRSTPERAS